MTDRDKKPKVLVIVGPTASGKSDLAVELALKFGGEVISADSRQVYRGLNIGTGKITLAEMKGVPHHLLDVADPNERYTVAHWRTLAENEIEKMLRRGRLPIVCGGTGFYIDALIKNLKLPDVESDAEEQRRLEAFPPDELMRELEKLDPDRAAQVRTSGDDKNPRRIARGIIIARELGRVPSNKGTPAYDALWIGLAPADAEIRTRIVSRLVKRLNTGMIDEAKHLHEAPPIGVGLSYERMNELGLEYRYLSEYLQKKLTREQLTEILSTKIWQYARRQKTWWRRNKGIRWFKPGENAEIERIVREFLS